MKQNICFCFFFIKLVLFCSLIFSFYCGMTLHLNTSAVFLLAAPPTVRTVITMSCQSKHTHTHTHTHKHSGYLLTVFHTYKSIIRSKPKSQNWHAFIHSYIHTFIHSTHCVFRSGLIWWIINQVMYSWLNTKVHCFIYTILASTDVTKVTTSVLFW